MNILSKMSFSYSTFLFLENTIGYLNSYFIIVFVISFFFNLFTSFFSLSHKRLSTSLSLFKARCFLVPLSSSKWVPTTVVPRAWWWWASPPIPLSPTVLPLEPHHKLLQAHSLLSTIPPRQPQFGQLSRTTPPPTRFLGLVVDRAKQNDAFSLLP